MRLLIILLTIFTLTSCDDYIVEEVQYYTLDTTFTYRMKKKTDGSIEIKRSSQRYKVGDHLRY